MKTKYYSITQSGDAAEIYIFGDLAPYDPKNTDEQPYYAMQELSNLDVKQIDVYIDSYGGSVSEGWAFYNALKKHPATVRTFGVGFVASAALFPFMAGEERNAYSTSVYFFHGVQGGDEEVTQKITEIGRTAFTERTGVDDAKIAQLQEAETWVSPVEMLQMGLATMLIGVETAVSATQNVRKKVVEELFTQRNSEKSVPIVIDKDTFSNAFETFLSEYKDRREEQSKPQNKFFNWRNQE